MSEKNRDGKRTARERMAVEREKQRAAEKRRRALIVGASVVCVLALATVAGVLAANAGKGGKESDSAGPAVAPSGAAGKDGLAIPVGRDTAPSTLTVWEDFRCPACQVFETAYSPTIHQLVDAGKLRVEYHLVTLIDGNMGGSGSRRAANAAACAQDAGKFVSYHDTLYRNQPKETQDSFGNDDKLIGLAGEVPGLDTPAFQKCVKDGRHNSWVVKSNAAFRSGGFPGTPTVLLGDKNIYADRTMTPAKLKLMVEAAAKR